MIVVTAPTGHIGQQVQKNLLQSNDMAQVMSGVPGKQVRYQQTASEAVKARLTGFGMSEAVAQAMVDMMTAKGNGLDNAEPRTQENSASLASASGVRKCWPQPSGPDTDLHLIMA